MRPRAKPAPALLDALRHFRDELKPLSPAQAVFQHSFAYTTGAMHRGCPSKIDVPKYIDGVKGGKFDFALGVILEKYSMAATCGRVCDALLRRRLPPRPGPKARSASACSSVTPPIRRWPTNGSSSRVRRCSTRSASR